MKTDHFQSCGHCWDFQICWHVECSTFIASSSRIWNSSTGIPSHPRALFIVMLPKAHLSLHSRMSGSRWAIIPLWLSWTWRLFFVVLLCILATSSQYLLLLLGPYHFCLLLSPSSLLFTAICKTSSDSYFVFLHFFFLGMVLDTASCTMSWTSIHSTSGTLSIRTNPLNLFVTSTV